MNLKNVAAGVALGFLLSIGSAFAGSSPNLTYGQVLTPGQWNQLFINKEDELGYTPLNTAGGIMTGRLVTAPASATTSGFNLPQGSTPASPANGDLWVTSAGLFAQANGVTYGPLIGAGSSTFAATPPIGVTFPAGVVTYAFDFTVANTFLAQQTGQGATTTSPGWYVQISGDTVPRAHIGTTSTDVAALSFGPGNATRDTFLQRAGAANFRHGAPDAAAPVAQSISMQNVVAGTSNTAGAALTVNGSQGTGTGAGGNIIFRIAPAGSTGSTQNALANALSISGTNGGIAIGALASQGVGTLNLAALYANNTLVVDSSANVTGATLTSLSTATLGANGGTAGQIVAKGSTSGSVNVAAQAAAGTPNLLWPTASGTLASTGTAPIVVNAGTGAISCPTCNTTGANVSTVSNVDGTLTISPTSGAVVASIALSHANTWTNQTFTSSTNSLGGVTMALGSDATGDIYYNNANVLTRLPKGSNGQALELVAGIPSWQTLTGTGTVTSITPGGGLVSSITASCSQTAITTTGTLSKASCVNAQVGTSYAVADGDRAKLVTSINAAAQAYTIAQAGAASAFQGGWYTDIHNESTTSAGIVTITPTTSTIDGAASIKIYPGDSARIVSDGTNYFTAFFDSQAWVSFTPSITCGTATITTTSAKTKTKGKTTLIELDWTITVLGTCNNAASLTWPNTPNSGGAIIGTEIAVGGKSGACRVLSGSTTGTCNKADASTFVVNEHYVMSGVYENQ